MEFTRIPHPAPTPDDVRDAKIADPGFGTVFTDHMVTIDYDEAKGGWQTPVLGPREPIALDPAASVLPYAQEIFEGMKAYRHPDGSLGLFRPEANAQRFNAPADRPAVQPGGVGVAHPAWMAIGFPTLKMDRFTCAHS